MMPRTAVAVTFMLCLLSAATARLPAALAQNADAPAPAPAPIMPFDQVRIGMKGYGLTVFHGTTIEPFPVEVVSIISDSSPGRGTIWIRCDDPRLEKSGPVQGMSGSPIYLWNLGEEKSLGHGGRLIGAFAFGYAMIKECLAGVQPIEFMRQVGSRAAHQPPTGEDDPSPQASIFQARRTLHRLESLAQQRGITPINRFRATFISQLMDHMAAESGLAPADDSPSPSSLPAAPPLAREGQVMPMMLPISIGSASLASFTAPLLEPMGLLPFADPGGSVAGPPPAGIDPDAVKLAPGSVLAIPLAYGDMDLSAVGTVTDVLPDGTVLGFGHPMFGQGASALPMATGYVHFIVPRITTSFKQSGSLQIKGSIVRDANAAVAGIAQRRFKVAPVNIDVRMLGLPAQHYQYQVVDHPQLTPILAMIVAIQSITAEQSLPIENTLYVNGDMIFTGDRHLPVDTILPGGQGSELLIELMPSIMAMMNNPHQNLKLQSINLSARVEPVLRVGALIHARLDQAQVAPGQDIHIAATVQPYGQAPATYHAALKIPAWLDEGDYQLMICDAATYTMLTMRNRPHLMATDSVDDLTHALRTIMSIRRDALYAVLQLPDQGVAVGGSEMPRLPSSRKAMIATPTSTLAVPFTQTAETVIPTDVVVQGQMPFTVAVRKKPITHPTPPRQSR